MAAQRGQLASQGPSKIEFPYTPPEEYDYRVTFERTDGTDYLMQHLVANGNQFIWVLGGWGGATCGFEPAGGPASSNATTRTLPGPLENNRAYTSVVKVRAEPGVQAFLDDMIISEWKTDYRGLDLWSGWRLHRRRGRVGGQPVDGDQVGGDRRGAGEGEVGSVGVEHAVGSGSRRKPAPATTNGVTRWAFTDQGRAGGKRWSDGRRRSYSASSSGAGAALGGWASG